MTQNTLFTADAPPSPAPATIKESWEHLAMYSDDQNAREICKTWREAHHDTGPKNTHIHRVRFEGRGAARCAKFERASRKAPTEWAETARIYARETDKTMMVTTAGRLLVITLDELRANWS